MASPRIVQELTELTGFVEDMRVLGRISTARVLSCAVVSAAPLVAEKLAVPAGKRVVQIQRVRLSDGVPLSFDEDLLPQDLGRRVMTDDLANEPIFTLLEERYDTPLLEAEDLLEAAAAEPAVAAALEILIGGPIFLIERTSYTSGHRPVDYERLHYRGDTIRFKTRLAGAALRVRRSAIDMLAASAPGLFCISVGASALGGALGMASGIFIVPILTLVANVDVHLAIGAYFVSTGIVLLVALPPMRVATMAVWFLINDDRDFALIAALVLAIIAASTLLGVGSA